MYYFIKNIKYGHFINRLFEISKIIKISGRPWSCLINAFLFSTDRSLDEWEKDSEHPQGQDRGSLRPGWPGRWVLVAPSGRHGDKWSQFKTIYWVYWVIRHIRLCDVTRKDTAMESAWFGLCCYNVIVCLISIIKLGYLKPHK